MAQYHLNNIPDTLMEHIRVRAAVRGITIRDYLINLVRRDKANYISALPRYDFPVRVICISDAHDNDMSCGIHDICEPSPRVGSETRGNDLGTRNETR